MPIAFWKLLGLPPISNAALATLVASAPFFLSKDHGSRFVITAGLFLFLGPIGFSPLALVTLWELLGTLRVVSTRFHQNQMRSLPDRQVSRNETCESQARVTAPVPVAPTPPKLTLQEKLERARDNMEALKRDAEKETDEALRPILIARAEQAFRRRRKQIEDECAGE